MGLPVDSTPPKSFFEMNTFALITQRMELMNVSIYYAIG